MTLLARPFQILRVSVMFEMVAIYKEGSADAVFREQIEQFRRVMRRAVIEGESDSAWDRASRDDSANGNCQRRGVI